MSESVGYIPRACDRGRNSVRCKAAALVVAALLSILLRKGLIADWEFVEELRKI